MARRPLALLAAAVSASLVLVGLTTSTASAVGVTHNTLTSQVPSARTPHVMDGSVYSMVQIGRTMVVGGQFTSVQSADHSVTYPRVNLFSFNVDTGAVSTTFVPAVNAPVWAVESPGDGTSVYVGGEFGTVNGATRKGITRLNLATGLATAGFAPPALNGVVKDITLSGGRMYIGGSFTLVGGLAHSGMATLNPATGKLDPFFSLQFTSPRPGGPMIVEDFDISPSGTTLVALGNFTLVGGQARNQIALITVSGTVPAVSTWATDRYVFYTRFFPTYVRDVEWSPDGNFFVTVATGGATAGTLTDAAARWEAGRTGAGQQPTWTDYTGGDTLLSVAVVGKIVYVAGHQRWLNNTGANNVPGPGAVGREGIGALDARNGVPLTWNPGRTRGVGARELYPTAEGLWVGSDTDRFAGLLRGRIAFVPLDPAAGLPADITGTLPNDLIQLAPTGNPTRAAQYRNVNGATVGAVSNLPTQGATFSDVRGGFIVDSTLYTGRSDGTFAKQSFDGHRFGSPVVLPVNGLTALTAFATDLTTATGMFWTNGRLYYTVAAGQMYYRYFTPQSGIVGADRFAVTLPTGFDGTKVAGMTLAGGQLLWAHSTTGALMTTPFSNGAPQVGTTVLNPQALGVNDWRSRALVLRNGGVVPNKAPVAVASAACSGLTCTLNGSASNDPDGSIASYAWSFGDGSTGSGSLPAHTYAADSTYTATLTVTDDEGLTASTTTTVVADAATGTIAGLRTAAGAESGTSGVALTVPATVQPGDGMLLFATWNTAADPADPAGWVRVASAVSGGAMTTRVYQRVADATTAGTSVGLTFTAAQRSSLQLVAYQGTSLVAPVMTAATAVDASTATHVSPTLTNVDPGAWLVTYWSDKSSTTTLWTSPVGVTVRGTLTGGGSGRVTSLTGDSAGAAPIGNVGGLTATTDAASSRGVSVSVLLTPNR